MILIDVPKENDSVSRVTLAGKEYNIRFTYNVSTDRWYFSILDLNLNPLIGMVKIVPLHHLRWQYVSTDLPDGFFGCWTELDKVGKKDFKNGNAVFGFIANEELEGYGIP